MGTILQNSQGGRILQGGETTYVAPNVVATVNSLTSPTSVLFVGAGDGGSVINDGTIVSVNGGGVEFFAQNAGNAARNSVLINGATGIIRGTTEGVQMTGFGGDRNVVVNAGQISATFGDALSFLNGNVASHTTRVSNSGVIRGGGDGVRLGSVLNLDNSGSISGEDGILSFDGGIDNYVYNTGSILGEDDGIGFLFGGARIVNYGEISGADGIRVNSLSSIFNYGTISQAFVTGAAVALSDSSDSMVNGGLIAGRIDLGNGTNQLRNLATGAVNGDITGGTGRDSIVNFGIITGAVQTGDSSDTVINHGAINGLLLLGDGDDVYRAVGSGSVSTPISGGEDNDLLIGAAGNDSMQGDAGNDTLRGFGGDDVLEGGKSEDSILGDDGADTLLGDSGLDTVRGGNGDDSIDGGSDQDELFGNAGNDTILGGGGNDTIRGGSGDDSIEGGTGNNNMNGGLGNDTVIGDIGNDLMRGNDGNDNLAGADGADTLLGGEGNDTITGGLGRDVMNGGRGADEFRFTSVIDSGTGSTRDLIQDFEVGTDLIVLSPLPGVFSFIGTAAFSASGGMGTGSGGEVRAIEISGGLSTLVQIDEDRDGLVDSEILLSFTTGVTAGDFLL